MPTAATERVRESMGEFQICVLGPISVGTKLGSGREVLGTGNGCSCLEVAGKTAGIEKGGGVGSASQLTDRAWSPVRVRLSQRLPTQLTCDLHLHFRGINVSIQCLPIPGSREGCTISHLQQDLGSTDPEDRDGWMMYRSPSPQPP